MRSAPGHQKPEAHRAAFVLDISHMGFAGGLLADAGLDGSQRSQAIRLIRQKNAHELARQLSQWQVAPFYAGRIAQLPTFCGDFTQTLRRAADIAVGADMKTRRGRAFQPVRGTGRDGLMRACAAGFFHSQ